jgi:Niemann-Pick C2 protein
VDEVRNRVFARVWGIPLPFIGVDGESSCENIYHVSGVKRGCPLQANEEYLYKNAFEIRSFYPSVSTK